MPQSKSKHKLIVIGLDGAPYPMIKQWTEEGTLPNLAQLIERGSAGVLRSTLPVHSPTAWASFMTGMNPGKHGVFDFVRRAPDSYQLQVIRAEQIHGASLWRLLSEAGRRVGVMNVPMTYPPEPVNGFLVSGLGTPDYVPYSYPAHLSDSLSAAGYRVNNRFFFDPKRQDEWLEDVFAVSEQRGQMAVQLLQQEEPDFFMVVFRNTDEICHFFWHHMDQSHPQHDPAAPVRYQTAIRDLYELVDKWVGRIVEAAGEDSNVVVMSDHGAGPLYQDVFLNEWLWQNGWLHLKEESGEGRWPGKVAQRFGLTRKRISDALTRWHLHRVEVLIKKVLGERIYVLPRDERPEFMNAIDWSKTKAYSFGYYGQIYINLKGREPQGIVEPGEPYAELRAEIGDRLKKLVSPADGRPIVDQIYTREELYHGPQLDNAPDLLTIMRNFSYITRKGYEFAEERGTLFRDPYTRETGSHRLEGTLIAAGPAIGMKQRLAEHAIQDLAPTLLQLLHAPIPTYMDGKLIEELLAPSFVANFPPKYVESEIPEAGVATWEGEQEAEVAERLKKLGYLG